VTGAKIYHGWYVDRIALLCRTWIPTTRQFLLKGEAAVVYVGPATSADLNGEACEDPRQPVRSIRGREAAFIDAIGFVCDEP
jgi:hypothetical protein